MSYKAYTDHRGPFGPSCKRCVLPIQKGEAAEQIRFMNDPDGKLRSLNGLYHARCAQPYLSMSRILNLSPWGRF
jgi:hypothetical protein